MKQSRPLAPRLTCRRTLLLPIILITTVAAVLPVSDRLFGGKAYAAVAAGSAPLAAHSRSGTRRVGPTSTSVDIQGVLTPSIGSDPGWATAAPGSPVVAPGGGPARAPFASSPPYFGLLQPDLAALPLSSLRRAGLTRLPLSISWSSAEPQPGQLNRTYLQQVLAKYRDVTDAGFQVVLDAGLQYAPSWVFGLDSGTRFVNQYGQAWHGTLGADVPDAVFDSNVRNAQASYLHLLADALSSARFTAIRVGGLANGELHYPVSHFAGKANSFWAFSQHAISQSPVPNYRPGTGNYQSSASFLSWYLRSIDEYGNWLAATYRSAFGPSPTLQVLLPSWGIRPGDIAQAESGLLSGTSRGEVIGTINEGLDWAVLLPTLGHITGVEAYSTWLDAPDQGLSQSYESPIRFIVGIAIGVHMPVSGENTGHNTSADMVRSFQRVRELNLKGIMWMGAGYLTDPRYANLAGLSSVINSSRG